MHEVSTDNLYKTCIDKAGNICYNYHESIIEYAWGSDTRGKRSLRGGYGRLVLTWRCDLGKEESPMVNNFNGLSCVKVLQGDCHNNKEKNYVWKE